MGGLVACRMLSCDGLGSRREQAADAGCPPGVSPRASPSAAPHGRLHHRFLAAARAFVPDAERRLVQKRFAWRENPTRLALGQAAADRPQDGYSGPSSERRVKAETFEARAFCTRSGEPS